MSTNVASEHTEHTSSNLSSLSVSTTTVYVYLAAPTPNKTFPAPSSAVSTNTTPSITPVTAPSNLISIVTAIASVLSLAISLFSIYQSQETSKSANEDHSKVSKLKDTTKNQIKELINSQKILNEKLDKLQREHAIPISGDGSRTNLVDSM